MSSNPNIFSEAIEEYNKYNSSMAEVLSKRSVERKSDIKRACDNIIMHTRKKFSEYPEHEKLNRAAAYYLAQQEDFIKYRTFKDKTFPWVTCGDYLRRLKADLLEAQKGVIPHSLSPTIPSFLLYHMKLSKHSLRKFWDAKAKEKEY